jgi:two-component system osmolarity sensor histidine kinase EnvZ
MGIALLATLLGSVASPADQPAAAQLSFAASRIRGGDLDSRLDENTLTSEIREVNMGFNRMARELARVEEDRAVMLAGISHDLRTPLARLRLETEMSVDDEEAKRNMAMDIDQLDAIIDKFMDYARPGETQLRPVLRGQLIDREAACSATRRRSASPRAWPSTWRCWPTRPNSGACLPEPVRERAPLRRGTYTGVAEVTVSHVRTGPWVICHRARPRPRRGAEKLPS